MSLMTTNVTGGDHQNVSVPYQVAKMLTSRTRPIVNNYPARRLGQTVKKY